MLQYLFIKKSQAFRYYKKRYAYDLIHFITTAQSSWAHRAWEEQREGTSGLPMPEPKRKQRDGRRRSHRQSRQSCFAGQICARWHRVTKSSVMVLLMLDWELKHQGPILVALRWCRTCSPPTNRVTQFHFLSNRIEWNGIQRWPKNVMTILITYVLDISSSITRSGLLIKSLHS